MIAPPPILPGNVDTAVEADEADALLAPWRDGGPILAAVSGGPDSLAMLVLLANWCRATSAPAITIATVDHGLRETSVRDAALVLTVAADHGLPARLLRLDGLSHGPALPERARAARYAALRKLAAELGCATLMTAHTLDDQAETLLMRMAAGSGVIGLAGIRPSSRWGDMTLARPLLMLPKARLIATCAAHGLRPADDSTNRDPRFARPRWRDLMPALAREGLTAERMGALAVRAAQHAEAITLLAAQRLTASRNNQDEHVDSFDGRQLLAPPLALARAAFAAAHRLTSGANDLSVDDPAFFSHGPRLKQLEATTDAFITALDNGKPLRRTLAGVLLTLDRQGRLALQAETPRRRPNT